LKSFPYNQDALPEINVTLAALGLFSHRIRCYFPAHDTIAAYGKVCACFAGLEWANIAAQDIGLNDCAGLFIPIGKGRYNDYRLAIQ
jgi:hypothetical protein